LNEAKEISIPERTITKDNVEAFQAELKKNLALGQAGRSGTPPEGAKKFAFITNVADPFWSHAQAGCYAAEKEFGIIADFEMNSAGDVAGQNKIIENVLGKGDYAGIALSSLNPANQTAVINDAAAKMPLICHDSDAPESNRLFYLGTNNYEAGRTLGKLVKERMPEGGKIMIYVGKIDQLNAQQRRDGLIDELRAE
jgi:ribose transport system substrate-binding protein